MNDWNRIGAPRPTSRSQLPQQHPGQHPQHSPQHPMHANATQQQYSSSGTSSYIAAQASMPQVVHAQYEQLQLSQNLSPHPPISIPRPHPPPKVLQKRHSLTPPSSNVNIIIAPLDFATRSVSPPLRPDSFAELQEHQQQQEQEIQQEQQRLQQRMGLHIRRSEDQDRLQEQGRQFAQMQQHQLHEQQRHIAHQRRLQQQHQQLAHQQQLQKQEQQRQLAEQLQLQEERRQLAEQQKLQKEEQERQLAQQLQIQEKRRQFKREKEEQERQIAQQLQMQGPKRQKEEQERQLAQQIKMQEEQRQPKARKEEEERRIARQLQMQEQQQLYAEEQRRHDEELEHQQLQLQEERRQLALERKRQKEEQARQRALQQKRQKEEEAHQLALQQKRGKDEQRLLAQQKPRQNNSHQSTPFVRPGTTTQIVQPSSAATRRDSSTSAAGQQNTGGRSSSTNNNTHPPASSPGPSQYFAEPMHPVGGWIYESTAPQKSLAPGPSSAGASVRPSHLVKTRAIAVTKSPTAREASSSATPSTGVFSYPQTGAKPSPDQLPPPTTVPASVQTRVVVGPKPSFSRIPSATTGSVSAGPSHRPPISIPPPAPAQIPSTIVPVAVGPSHQQLPAPAPVTPLAPVVAPVQIPMLPALTKEEEASLVKEAENFKKGIETIAKEYHRIWPYPPAGFQVSTMMLQRMRAIMALDPELPKPFIAKALGISLIHFNLWLKGMLKRGVHQGVQEKIERLVGNFIARKYFSIRAFQARKIRRTQEWTHSEKNRRNNSRGRPPAVTKELAAIYNGTEIQIGNNNTRIVHTRPVTSVAANNNAGGAGQKGAATKNTGGVVAAKKGAVVPAIPVRTALYNGITNPKLTEKQKVVFPFWARNAIKQNDIKNYAKAKPEVSSQYLHNHVQVRNEPPHIRRIENHAFSYYVHKPPPTPVVIVPKKKNNNTGATSKKNKKNTKSANTSTATKSPKPRRARPGKPRASVELTAAAHRPRRSSRHQDETAKKKISNNDNTGPSTIIKNVESVKPQTSAKKVIPSVERESEKEKIEKDAGGSSSYTDVAQSGIAAYAAKAAELNRIARTRHSNPSKDGGVAKTNSTPTKNDPQHSNPNSNSASEKQQASKDAGVPTNNSTPTKNKTPEKGAPAISTDDAVSCPPTPFVDDREGSPAEENNSMSGTKAAWSWIKNISSAIRNSNVVTPQEKDNNTPAKRPIEKAENEEEKEEDGRALNKKPRLE